MKMSDDVLVKVENVSKKFCRTLKRSLWYGVQDVAADMFNIQGQHDELRPGEFWSVDDVSFDLKRGECLGLIGPNGAGKSTLLKMLNGLIKPDCGQITMRGRVGGLIELGAGFNPILTGLENIYVNGSVLGLSKREIDAKLDAIIEFSEMKEFIDTPVQSYSSGMKVRLGFAIAAQIEPEVLLIDEVLAVGDVGFRSKCYSRLADLVEKCAVIFVSHQMYFVNRLSSSALLLNRGRNVFHGEPPQAIAEYNSLFEHKGKVVRGDENTEVENISLLDHDNVACDSFDWCALFVLEFDLHVSRQYEEVSLSATFMGLDGALAAQCHSSYNNVKLKCSGKSKRVRLEIDNLDLNPGVYYLNLIVYDKTDNRQLYWLYAGKKFEVVGNFCGGASVQFKGRWQLT